jgi:predicted Zn-ribbon and HTH transcriptional regulator
MTRSDEQSATDRQRLLVALESGPVSARELSAMAGVPERDVATHLEHLAKSLRHEGGRLGIAPARCQACGFRFDERRRLGRPSRCPKCRSTHLAAPRFWVER